MSMSTGKVVGGLRLFACNPFRERIGVLEVLIVVVDTLFSATLSLDRSSEHVRTFSPPEHYHSK